MGSLGFLTPFSYDNYSTDIERVLNGKHGISGATGNQFIEVRALKHLTTHCVGLLP